MITIGIRVSPKIIFFAIYDSDTDTVVNIEGIKVPAAFSTPESLKYVRNTILDILREYQVAKAGIRITESMAKGLSIERVQIEGVIQEAFASSSLKNYYIGQISSIAAKLGIDRADFKKYLSGELDFERVESWGSLSQNEKEAVFCAIGATNV